MQYTIIHADGTPDPDTAKKLSAYCFDNGLISLVCGIEGNVICVLMPLVIEDDQLQNGLNIMEVGLSSLAK